MEPVQDLELTREELRIKGKWCKIVSGYVKGNLRAVALCCAPFTLAYVVPHSQFLATFGILGGGKSPQSQKSAEMVKSKMA